MLLADSAGGKPMPFDCTPIVDTIGNTDLLARRGAEEMDGVSTRLAVPPRPVGRRSSFGWDIVAVLVRARQFIAQEQHWCKGAFSRGWFHVPVRAQSQAARRFCAHGAILRAARELRLPINGPLEALEARTGGPSLQDWNDNPRRTHAEVLGMFDAAIKALQ
jgi:hypothetical protein